MMLEVRLEQNLMLLGNIKRLVGRVAGKGRKGCPGKVVGKRC